MVHFIKYIEEKMKKKIWKGYWQKKIKIKNLINFASAIEFKFKLRHNTIGDLIQFYIFYTENDGNCRGAYEFYRCDEMRDVKNVCGDFVTSSCEHFNQRMICLKLMEPTVNVKRLHRCLATCYICFLIILRDYMVVEIVSFCIAN